MWQNFPKYLRFTSSVQQVISSVQVIPGPVSKEEQLLWERKKWETILWNLSFCPCNFLHSLKLISMSLQFCTKIKSSHLFDRTKPRCASWGITSYDLDPTSGRIIFPAGGSLFFCADPATGHTGELPCDHYILFQNQSHVLVGDTTQLKSWKPSSLGPLFPYEIKTKTCGARLNATMCPHNPDVIAFVNNGDIWVTILQISKKTWSYRNLTGDPPGE